jgi:hypothetical protein
MKTAILLCLIVCLSNAAPPTPIFWSTTGSNEVTPAQIQTLMTGIASGSQFAMTGNATIAPSVTLYFPLNNSANPMTWNADVSGGTRSICTTATLYTNMQMISSVAPGSGGCVITLMTNGVASLVACKLTTNTKTNDSTHSVSVAKGVEVGWRLATGAGVTAAKYEVAIETRQ